MFFACLFLSLSIFGVFGAGPSEGIDFESPVGIDVGYRDVSLLTLTLYLISLQRKTNTYLNRPSSGFRLMISRYRLFHMDPTSL